MTTTQPPPHHPHHHHISAPSAIGVLLIVLLSLGFVTLIAVLLVRAVTPESHTAHVEGMMGQFATRNEAREEAHRRVGVLVIKEPCDISATPPTAAEDFTLFQFGDTEMSLHLIPTQAQNGRWDVKWTADLRGTEGKNLEIITAWQAAASGQEVAPDPTPNK